MTRRVLTFRLVSASTVPQVRVTGLAVLFAITCVLIGSTAHATLVFEQPPDPGGGVLVSSWYPPDGTDYDAFVYDSFQLSTTTPVTEVRWRGGYFYTGYGLVTDFSITFYASIAGGSQPLCGLPGDNDTFLARYEVGGTAGQTLAGTFGGIVMYDYQYTLPQPFQAQGGVKYWVQIEGYTAGLPFWGIARGLGGNGQHFRYIRGAHQFSFGSGDAAFSLHTTAGPTYQIVTSVSPDGAGTTAGDGAYPPGFLATVIATPNPGWGFVNWTENGNEISTTPDYTFSVSSNRSLVANFMTAYTIAASAQPAAGGIVTGAGSYNAGTSVTVDAMPNIGWVFVDWTEFGTPVSNSPSYTFIATADRQLVANFALSPGTVLFDFDNAPAGTSLPISLTANDLTARFTGTGSGYSVQRADVLGFIPAGFAGLCLYPNSVFPADLLVGFSRTLSDFAIMFSPQELGCDDSATLRATAYRNGSYVGTNTAVASPPGTWPTGTLTFSDPAGFDSVVVHYDSPPPTCQDWGPIFLADNMYATVLGPTSVTDGRASPIATAAPNPFTAGTVIQFTTDSTGLTTVTVHDMQGRLVRTLLQDSQLPPSLRAVSWDGRDSAGQEVSSGVYFFTVKTGRSRMSGRLVRLQ